MAKIKLEVKGIGETREFEKAHAIALLGFAKSQFKLPEDSQYQFIDNELKRRPTETKDSEKSSKRKSKPSTKA